MAERFLRTEMLLHEAGMQRLKEANILVFGIGGVGGHAVEALARCGVASITLVDNDTVSVSNINRQIIATNETIGMKKTEAMKARIHSINPDCRVTCLDLFYLPDSVDVITSDFHYIIDAIDTVSAKIDIAVTAQELGIPLISCMGTGNKLHPELLCIDDIYNTSVCPLCRVMRYELKKRNVTKLTVVYSTEQPIKPNSDDPRTPGSISFVPSVAGLLIASRVVQDITKRFD